MPKEDKGAAEVQYAQEIIGMTFITHNKSSEVLELSIFQRLR